MEEHFNTFSKSIAKISLWLKEASEGKDKHGCESFKSALKDKKSFPPMMSKDGFTRVLKKTQVKQDRLAAEGVYNQKI